MRASRATSPSALSGVQNEQDVSGGEALPALLLRQERVKPWTPETQSEEVH